MDFPPDRISFALLEEAVLSTSQAKALRNEAVHRFSFLVYAVVVEVRFSDFESYLKFAARYVDMPKVESEGTECYFVVRADGDTYFWSDPNDARVLRRDLGPDIVAFLADSGLAWFVSGVTNAICLHAAVVAGRSKMLAIGGRSTAGKTTTAIACVRRGLRLYTDERCLVRADGTPPYLRSMTLREGGRVALAGDMSLGSPRLRELLTTEAEFELGEASILPSELSRHLIGGPVRKLDAIMLISGRRDVPEIQPISRFDALEETLDICATVESELARVERVLRETRHVRFYRLLLGAPDETALALAEFAQGVH